MPRNAARGLIVACLFILAVLLGASGEARASVKLKTAVPDLCYQCHVKLRQELSRKDVHFPFKEGMCTACHNVHTSDMRSLMREEINPLCLSCHSAIKDALKKGHMHGALKDGVCTDCHYAHSSENKALLVTTEDKLCWSCHEKTLETQLANADVHSPFKEKQCSSCHDPHASTQPNQLVAKPNKVCQQCHAPRCNVKGTSITFITKTLDCTTCHAGHSSPAKSLLGPYGHPMFLEKDCEACHNPFVENKKPTTWAQGSALCFSCHEKRPDNFRENDIHGTMSDNPCTMCHTYHAAKSKRFIVQGVCLNCHGAIEQKINVMKRALTKVHRESECINCHKPMHSSQPYYFRSDVVSTCSKCHQSQHKISHPVGGEYKDPRNGQQLTCISCHSMHDARADFMLYFDRKRQLCIQCHKV